MMHSLYGSLASQEQLMQAAAAAAMVDPLIANRDTTFTKIFVGGLPYHTSDKTLHEYFEQFGEIEEAVVITDRQTQKSRGYGFVTMKDRASAERACKEPNPIIDGRKANVNLAYLGAKPRGNLQLAALSSGMQLPLQTQLQALFPGRLGLPQLYYPTASSLGHGLVIPSVSPLSGTTAASPAVSVSNAQAAHYLDYATLAAAQNAYANHPAMSAATAYEQYWSQVNAATGYEQYAYSPYGMIPASYAAQLTAQSVAASQHGVASTDNGARVQ